MARLPTLTPKRLGAMDRARIRSRATYETSGFDASVDRLSSLLRWYYLRLARTRLTWTLLGDMTRQRFPRP